MEIDRLVGLGGQHIAGGTLPERKRGNFFPDGIVRFDNGEIFIEAGVQTQGGDPVAREKRKQLKYAAMSQPFSWVPYN